MDDIQEAIVPEEQRKISEVGYKKPPKEYQFKPGVSGNPGGRPEGMSLTKVIRERLKKLTPDGKRTALDFLADNIIQDALENNNKMRTLIWNYLDGMPKQNLDIEGSLEVPLVVKLVRDDGSTTETRGV